MCGRFAINATPDEVAAHFALTDLEGFPPRYNIAPGQPILVVLPAPPREPGSNLPAHQAMLVRWGLIPAWSKDPANLPMLFNARAETAADKASFRAAMRHRRALVPASGFYEWRRVGRNKAQPYWIRPKEGGLVAFAALVETYAEPGGSEIDTAAILTTAARGELAAVHDRMPVVIRPADFARWLDCRTQEPRDVADLMLPPEQGMFEAIPVANLVNSVENTGPELQHRAELPAARGAAKPARPVEDRQLKLF